MGPVRAVGDRDGAWWRRATIYQVYPRSFQDSDGDGIGDLEGVRSRLEYLAWLGVDAMWMSPFYRSPMADFGYDVCDHCDVDPLFGTLADWDRLAADARSLGLRLILDLVVNHTSDQHPWFQSARRGERRDWYLWHDGTPDHVPNNWVSVFGGSAWSWDAQVGKWYYHAYLPQQPDLNWRNPEVVAAVARIMRFWLDRGADGFRIDALRQFLKDASHRDNPANSAWKPGEDPYAALIPEHTTDRPELLEIVSALRATADQAAARDGRERLLIGELYLPLPKLMRYYGAGLNLPSNFALLSAPWTASAVASLVEEYEGLLPEGAWPNWVLGNHDRSRVRSRVGEAQTRVAAVLLLTLRGTPTLYYGDELGMADVDIPPERVRDPWEHNVAGQGLGRDPERTPMQWDDSANAGFCAAHTRPWLPLASDRERVNVAVQQRDPNSMLSLYRALLELRRGRLSLRSGSYRTLAVGGGVLAYVRASGAERTVMVLNLSSRDEEVHLNGLDAGNRIALATVGESWNLQPGEAVPTSLRVPADGALVFDWSV